mmetsp:Transcript_1420/g.2311  ORF Transcript_1420/g.2311 Transcript_1420/m.2311 type:complete len:251 (-) Transcript_1420:251-1003(-)
MSNPPLGKLSTAPNDNTLVVIPTIGSVYKIETKINKVTKITYKKDGLRSLAGIECVGDYLLVCELFKVSTFSFQEKSKKIDTAWRGTEVGDGEMYYLADNLSYWDDAHTAISIYRQVDANTVALMDNSCLTSMGWAVGKLLTSCVNCFTCKPNQLDNAELWIELSNKDVFENICFCIFNVKDCRRWHFTIDNNDLKLPAELKAFDGHVTHVDRHAGKIIFVNFLADHLLILDEDEVVAALNEPPLSPTNK